MKTERLRAGTALIFLILCLTLGGASGVGAGAVANGALQVLAVIVIVAEAWTRKTTTPVASRTLIGIGFAFTFVVLVTLVPLPYEIWSRLPGRDEMRNGIAMLGMGNPNLPASLTPQDSLGSIVRLLPPAAMFLLVLGLTIKERQRLLWVVLGIAIFSIVLGAAQLLGGTQSELRFYEVTNSHAPVGFFANANHQATLLLTALPCAAYLAARGVGQGRDPALRRSGVILASLVSLFLVVGILIVGSTAGYGLLAPTAVASLLIYRRAAFGPLTRGWVIALGTLLAVFIGLALAGPLSSESLGQKFNENATSRKVMAENTLEAARHYFPLGSGLGSFAEVYRTFDDPDRVVTEYVNHAHNDYLEIALELGLPGPLLVLVFFGWYAKSALRAWRTDFEGANLARVGSVAIAVVLFHSVVDYPIRTAAIAAMFALACGLLLPAPPKMPRSRRSRLRVRRPAKHLEAAA